ncbi:MAG: DNA polymerase/3'-5' exonuclease PolX [Vicinamibacterales bacterium]|jgi:DNA polymerase (family 10)|nr:DNA polymerase III [Acidobacteriota bacterium]MDP7295474.1 DNA polymerase/3'-5' exonuclease PolX [Vicinamibacterales bacterium]MDP7671406.1 DNA polymerase/3'-5' exonuclease PolX [Vicinamibacterales bacterium]HJO39275.1 DNA polymerase/3'-5' exonuclease PolX [Vicinamibacterales bacterium]
MDNLVIARVFSEIGDLLELKGENPFKIRAYRTAADIVGQTGERVTDLTDAELRAIPGIGKTVATKIRELADTGQLAFLKELLEEFPPTILDLLRLQGVGPKTVARLYRELGIGSVDALESAAAEGRLRGLRGLGAKKEQLMLRAVAEYRRREGRFPMPDVQDIADALAEHLRGTDPDLQVTPVGSLRRGCETCGDADLLVAGTDLAVLERFTAYPGVDRVLGRGETKASVLLTSGLQADLRLVPPESVGAALQYFTGSKAHNIALRDRAVQRGLKLNEYGVYQLDTGERVAGATEPEVYAALALPFIPPELREGRGEIAAADTDALPHLVSRSDLRGDLHAHTTESDGRADLDAMAIAAREAGLEYLAITEHSKSLAMANGLDERRTLAHARRIREADARLDGITLLAGIECDILRDGALDLAEDCLAELDIVVASVHSAFSQEEREMTDRLLRAVESPVVDVIGHPTGRLLRRRDPYRVNIEELIGAAAAHGVALEINSQVDRLDLCDAHARLARDRGVPVVINSDAHATNAFELLRWGIVVARRAWLEPEHVLNTRSVAALRAGLRCNRN